jgi:hypothetical protein
VAGVSEIFTFTFMSGSLVISNFVNKTPNLAGCISANPSSTQNLQLYGV